LITRGACPAAGDNRAELAAETVRWPEQSDSGLLTHGVSAVQPPARRHFL